MNEHNQMYIQYKDILYGKYKSPKYLDYVHKKYPHKEMHHILMKQIDYLVSPIDHWQHMEYHQKHRQSIFPSLLLGSVNLLTEYARKELGLDISAVKQEELTPQLVKDIIIKVHNKHCLMI
jgi:hypothetical protein